MPLTQQLLAASVALIWGLSFIIVKWGVDEIPPLMLAALRFLLTALPAMFFIRAPATRWTIVVGYGLMLGAGQFGFVFTAIKWGAPVGMTSIVVQTQVFFTILLTIAIFGERPRWFQIAGTLIAFAGVVLIGYRRAGGAELVPFFMVVAAAFCWGSANVIGKLAGRIDMMSFVVWSALPAGVALLALSLALEGRAALTPLAPPSWSLTAIVLTLAYVSTIYCFGVWSHLLSRWPAAAVAPFALLVPVFGLLSAAFVLGETITAIELIGGSLVLAGLAFTISGGRLPRLSRR